MNIVQLNSANSKSAQTNRGDVVSIETVRVPNSPRFGADGLIASALFSFLATLHVSRSTAPTRTAKLWTFMGTLVLYVVARIAYDPRKLRPSMLEVLASVSRELKQYKHAIRCGEFGLRYAYVPHTTKMLFVAGLMRAHDALYAADKPGSPAYLYFRELRVRFECEDFDPLEAKISVLRSLAWFTHKYPAREYIDAKKYAGDAMMLAALLRDEEQLALINREFTEFFQTSHQSKARTKGEM